MKVAFDLDGVVYNLITPFDKYMKRNGFSIADKSSYDLGARYGIPEVDGWLRFKSYSKTHPFRTLPLYKKAKNLINKTEGEIFVITHREKWQDSIEDTLWRIKHDNLPVKNENIIFSKNKGYWANKLGIDLFYEDSLENAEDILKQSNSLVKIIDQPYNQIIKDLPGVSRIKW